MNGDVDVGETAVGGAPTCVINQGSGSLSFSASFATSTARDYILRADIDGNNPERTMVFSLTTSNVALQGQISLQAITIGGSVASAAQFRQSRGGGGGGVGVAVPATETPRVGATVQSGGGGAESPTSSQETTTTGATQQGGGSGETSE